MPTDPGRENRSSPSIPPTRAPWIQTDQEAEVHLAFDRLRRSHTLLPVKVTPFFQKKVEEEYRTIGGMGPLYRMVYPTEERLSLKVPGEVPDFVEDKGNMPQDTPGSIIHKYPDRLLFMPTSICAAHCQYCFRQDILADPNVNFRSIFEQSVEDLVAYLGRNPGVSEVIVSGGDPLTLPHRDLLFLWETVSRVKTVRFLRLHTKTISFSPQVFRNEEKLEALKRFQVRLVFHIAHPYEICEEVRQTIIRLSDFGIACYNQFPLLRNINDHAEVIRRLLQELDSLRVRNLSVFVPEPIYFSAPFRMTLARFYDIAQEVAWTTPSWINATRFLLDTPIGKVRKEDLSAYNPQTRRATFTRAGKTVHYPDFPQEHDIPGELRTLLWKEAPRNHLRTLKNEYF